VDEARRAYGLVGESVRSHSANLPSALERLADLHRARVATLEADQQAIAAASALVKPVVFFFHLDRDIALGTLGQFQPALPLDPIGLAYGFLGMVAGWIVYDLVTAPLRPRSRRADIS
jgi:hypothetical protein